MIRKTSGPYSLEELNSPFGGADRIPCEIWGQPMSEEEAAMAVEDIYAVERLCRNILARQGVPGYYLEPDVDMQDSGQNIIPVVD